MFIKFTSLYLLRKLCPFMFSISAWWVILSRIAAVRAHSLLQYVGRVGSSFTDKELAEIAGAFSPQDRPPFANAPATAEAKWVEPQQVVQVSALAVTEDGHLRAPVF